MFIVKSWLRGLMAALYSTIWSTIALPNGQTVSLHTLVLLP